MDFPVSSDPANMLRKIDPKSLLLFSLAFFLIAVIGTVSHECGHYLMAKLLGHDAVLSFNYTSLVGEEETVSERDRLLITMAGPLQTMLFGTLGLVLLVGSGFRQQRLGVGHWLRVFLALFWCRQTVNVLMLLAGLIRNGQLNTASDEVELAAAFGLPPLSLGLSTGIAGAVVAGWVFFNYVPARLRLSFFLAGLFGGGLGYLIWVRLL